ncbi:MAG TPA: hypothetical protein VNC50_08895, partial [Planctomycetia bacterium]|nr:hypothetical protein [Planctomycetia bacterium]
MAQEFYTLEEAAAKLGRSLDDVREMARNPREIRSFRDGSSFKFRKQDIDEMARKWSLLSDPDMSSGDSIHGDDANILSSDDMPVVIDEGALSGLGLGSSKKVSGPGSSGAFQPGSSRKGGPGSSSTGLGSGKGGPGSDLKLAFQDDDVHSGKIGAKPADSDVKLAFDDGSGLTGVLSQGATPRVTPDELEATAHIDVSALGPGSGKSGPGSGKRGLESTAAFDLGPGSGKDSGKNLAGPGSGKGGDDLDFNFDDDAGSGLKLASDKSDSDFDLAGFDTGAAEKAKGPAKHAGLDKAMDLDDSDTFALA